MPVPSGGPAAAWAHRKLYERVLDALYALPDFFKTSLNIAGARVTDLYTLNSALGALLEQSVVEGLNSLRPIWDPDGTYKLYSFVRQNQVFPDVLLQTAAPGAVDQIILGIELKGWFALAKEGEPSFRYTVSPSVCADADLLVVFPWVFDEVISGHPKLQAPFVAEAKFAALHRNHYWAHVRGSGGPADLVTAASHTSPYPKKSDKFNDVAVSDPGKNFGRIARGKIMDAFIANLNVTPLAGIPLGAWQRFIKIFSEAQTEAAIEAQLSAIEAQFGPQFKSSGAANAALHHLVDAALEFASLKNSS
jgi:hypothetical protein